MRLTVLLALTLNGLATSVAGAEKPDAEKVNHFERKIRPLLIERCGECHGEEKPESGLTLTTVEGLLKGGKSGRVLVPSNPTASRLIQVVRYTAKMKMPPDGKLDDREIVELVNWVKQGATLPVGRFSNSAHSKKADNGPLFTDEERSRWSFQPIREPMPPSVENQSWPQSAIDRFILAKLEANDLKPNRRADSRALIRRATFDLLGLPPTPQEIDSFEEDSIHNPQSAFRNLIDRLLASPHYGERWGRHWLDVARYADTNGGGFDYVYPTAYHYRDYVVRALNADKPYDQFVMEQLAGDLMPIGDDAEAYSERLKATGFLTLAPKGLGMQDKEQMILDVVDDQIDVVGRTLMGLTLACARCHDHKFDPIPTQDYYSLAGIFRSTVFVSDADKNPSYWPERPLEHPSIRIAREDYNSRKAANEKTISETKKTANEALIAEARGRLPDYLFAAARIYHTQGSQLAVAHWAFDEEDASLVKATRGPSGKLDNHQTPGQGLQPTRSEGRFGQALRFAGKRDVVAFDSSRLSAVDFGTATDFSVSLWLRAAPGYKPQTADTVLALNYDPAMWFIALRPGAYNGVYLRHYDGKRTVDIKPNSNQLPALTNQQWHHLVFTSDRNGEGVVYLDGRQVGSVDIAPVSGAASFSGSKSFYIGAATNAFRGDLDDVAIWDRLLSPKEVTSLFTAASEFGFNVAQVEESKQRNAASTGNEFTYEQAAEQGLIPSVVKNFVSLFRANESDPKSPLHSLTTALPKSRDDVNARYAAPNETLTKLLNDEKKSPFILGADAERLYSSGVKQKLAELNAAAKQIESTRVADPQVAMVAFDAGEAEDLKVHIAGNRKNLGALAPRGFPRIIATPDQSSPTTQSSGRLELAQWVVHPEHPLTARVIANRVWRSHFGEGLVRTPDNFGQLGETPSHPELLDWLARRLIESGWSIKALHREIMLSATYQQSSRTNGASSAVDSGNRLLWRMNRRRLEAEPIRDAMLAVSGQLDRTMFGSVQQWKAKDFSVDDANAETANYKTRRRSVYLPIVRDSIHAMLELFDFGDPNSITPARTNTTVAPQALFMMNAEFVVEQARRFAERLLAEDAPDDTGRIRKAYQRCFSREPSSSELERSLRFLGSQRGASAESEKNEIRTWTLLCQALFSMNEFIYVE
jgi:hypothetical protein